MHGRVVGLCALMIGLTPCGALAGDEATKYFEVARQAWQVSAENKLSVYPLTPGPRLELAGCGSTGFFPAPDQKKAVRGHQHNLFLIDLERGTEAQITHFGREYDKRFAAVEVLASAWSTDSQRLLFCVEPGDLSCVEYCDDFVPRRANHGFFEYDVARRSIRKVARRFEFRVWLPDGRMIGEDPNTNELRWAQSGRFGALVAKGLRGAGQPAASPDGKRLLVSVNLEPMSRIFEIELGSGAARPLSPAGVFAEYQWPTYSPGGRHVAYTWKGPPVDGVAASKLIVDGTPKFSCQSVLDYAWIDDERIGLYCGEFVNVIDAVTGRVVGQHSVK